MFSALKNQSRKATLFGIALLFLATQVLSTVALAVLASPNVYAGANDIDVEDHEGQLKPSNTWSNGNITTYKEGENINFRFEVKSDNPASGRMKVQFTVDDPFCKFFDGTFVLGSIQNISGTSPTVTKFGSPVDAGEDWEQSLDVVFSAKGKATVNYTLKLSNEAGECNGSSQHTQLAKVSGDFKNIGSMTVPIPAKDIIELPEIYVEKWVDTNSDGQVDRRATQGEWSFKLDNGTPVATDANGKVTFTNVTPDGNHTITESNGPAGQTFLSGSGTNCTFSGSTATANVAQGTTSKNATCIFNNGTAPGKIKIVKNAVPNNLQDFSFTATGSGVSNFSLDDDSGVDGGNSPLSNEKQFTNLSTGTYTFTEAAVAGWDLSAINCSTGAQVTKNLENRSVSIQLSAGQDVTCTFVNDQRGNIVVTKQTNPDNDPTVFSITANGAGVVGTATQNISDNQSVTYTVKHGTYSVSETVPAGWSLTGNTCNDLTINGNTSLVSGVPTVSCTLTNTKLSKITVVKDAVPNSPQDFVFSSGGNLGGFILDDDSDATRSNQQEFSGLLPGSYSFSETTVNGWDLTGLTCTGTGVQFSANGATVNVTLGAGQNITCTFTNTQRGSISGIKFNDLNGNGVYDQGEPALSGWNIFIDTNNDGILDGNELSTFTDGDGLYSFLMLQPTTYNLAEVMQNGWVQTLSPGSVTVGAGENVTDQNFGNFQNGSIAGYKFNDINGDGQKQTDEPKLSGWTINLLNDNEDQDSLMNNVVESKVTDQNGEFSFTNVPKGVYQVCEVQQSGWAQTLPAAGTCYTVTIDESGETNPNTIFGNQGRASITIKKNVDTDGDGTANDLNSAEWNFDINGEGNYVTGSTIEVPAGQHTVKEVQKTDYHFVSVSCTNDRQVTQAEEFTVTVNPGDSITCTYLNARDTGTIKVVKNIVPSNDTGTFNLLINGEIKATVAMETFDKSTGEVKVPTGTHTVSETGAFGTDLNDYIKEISGACDSTGSVTVAKDENKECYITNTRKATINVTKNAVPNDPQDFNFEIREFNFEFEPIEDVMFNTSVLDEEILPVLPDTFEKEFTLDDDDDPTLPNTEETSGLTPGWYEIEEFEVEGWDLTGVECNDEPVLYRESLQTLDYNGEYENGVDNPRLVYVGPGDVVDCTFTNVKRGSVTIIKDAEEYSDTEFPFSHNFDGKESEDFVLIDDGENEALAEKKFSNVKPGEYWFEEGEVDGWELDEIVCDNEYDGEFDEKISPRSLNTSEDEWVDEYEDEEEYYDRYWVNVRPGEDVTCTVYNDLLEPELTVIKEVINNSGNNQQPSDFTYNVVSGPNGETRLENIPANIQGPYILDPGQYEVTENEAVGYTTTYSESCKGTINYGDSVICYITNDDNPPVLNITKSNNRPNPTTVGDVVTYTLEVTVPEDSGIVFDTQVNDLPPDNFEYVAGSYTANSNERGNLKTAGVTTPPTYASPGQWQLGDMKPGEKVTLTYQATISNVVTPGTYPDIAFAVGAASSDSEESGEVLSNMTVASTPFVGTQVAVASPVVASVFTAPEVLARTGSYFPALLAVIPALMLGIGLLIYKRSRRLEREGGQR